MNGRSISAAGIVAVLALAGCGDRAAQQGANETGTKNRAAVAQPVQPTPAPRSIMQPSVIPEPTPTPTPPEPVSRTIPFPDGGSQLDDAAKAMLDQLIANPTTASGGMIVLRGSSDSAGSDEDNLVTSRKRAEAVAAYLKAKGIAPDRLTIIALGEGRPAAPNVKLDGSDNPDGRARNRRVDIVVSPGVKAAGDAAQANADGGERSSTTVSSPPIPAGGPSPSRDDRIGR